MTEQCHTQIPKGVALFGGTFDPPHEGHVACVRIALVEFGHLFNKVLVTPSNAAYYKQGAQSSAEDRLELCRRAFAPLLEVEVWDGDIARGGVTYTADTLRDLRERFGAETPLYVILGADSYVSLPSWKDAAYLAEAATYVVIPRVAAKVDSYWNAGEATQDAGAQVAHPGFRTLFAAEAAPEVSSTALRERLSRGESTIGLLSEQVLWYIHDRNLYECESPMTDVSKTIEGATSLENACTTQTSVDVYAEAYLSARKDELASRVGEKRFRHCLGVAETAGQMAEAYGADPRQAYLAGLLHDWDKAYDDEGARARVKELGLDISEEVLRWSPQTLHAFTGGAALRRDFPELPEEICWAVERHTTGAVDMSDLDMIVYIADAIEPNRHFAGLDTFRKQAGEIPLEDLFFEIQAYWITIMVERKKTLHPDTFVVWNYYARRYRERHDKRVEFKK